MHAKAVIDFLLRRCVSGSNGKQCGKYMLHLLGTYLDHHSRKMAQEHQTDLIFLLFDKVGRKLYKCAFTIVDVASRYRTAFPLTHKTATQVANGFKTIYVGKTSPLTWPNLLQVGEVKEFVAELPSIMTAHKVRIRRGEKGNHRTQAIEESFNRRLAERLFRYQYAEELLYV